MAEPEVSRTLGNNFTLNIRLGFFIQIVVTLLSAAILFASAKSDVKDALKLGNDAIVTAKDQSKLLNDFNQRLMKLETRQEDFQTVYERDANKYIRDFNDRYNKLNAK